MDFRPHAGAPRIRPTPSSPSRRHTLEAPPSRSRDDEYLTQTRNAYRDAERAESYDRQHSGSLSWARFTMWREVRIVARFLGRYASASTPYVLDVPCGTGIGAPAFHARGARVVAADISVEMMQVGAHRYGALLSGLVQTDITRTAFPDDCFDGAVVLGFLHRVPAEMKLAVMEELGRVSRRFVVASVSVDSWSQRLKRRLVRILKPGHAFAPAPEAWPVLARLFEEAGFRIVATRSTAPLLSAEKMVLLEPRSRPGASTT